MNAWPQVGQQALAFILNNIASEGKPPSLLQIKKKTGVTSIEAVKSILDKLESRNLIYRKPGNKIVAAYPLSVEPTPHRVRLADGRWVYAMCAVDAFGVSFLFKQDITVFSRCHGCQRIIEVKVERGQIAASSPDSVLVWYTRGRGDRLGGSFNTHAYSTQEMVCCIPAEDQCPSINFFCSYDHFEEWSCNSTTYPGQILSLDQALDRASRVFEPFLMLGEKEGML